MKAVFDNPMTSCRELWINERCIAYITELWINERCIAYITKTSARGSSINDVTELEDGSAICLDGWGEFEAGKVFGNISAINAYNKPK